MKKLKCHFPNPVDATSFYRGLGPLGDLRKNNEFEIVRGGDWRWAEMKECDACFLQRPFTDDDLTRAKVAKMTRTPLWVDYDDDLFSVPTDNRSYSLYARDGIRKNMATIAAMADQLTVSTPAIAKQLKKLNPNVTVIPNGLDLDAAPPRGERNPSKHVLWRGSETHTRDLMTVERHIVTVASDPQFSEWAFNFIGFNPWWIIEQFPPKMGCYSPAMDLYEYMKFLKISNPAVLIVPLHPSKFNMAKSNIAYLEATYAGAVCLAPDFEEFRRPGCMNYDSPEQFETLLRMLITDEDLRRGLAETAWQHVRGNELLVQRNEARLGVLHKLMGYFPGVLPNGAERPRV